LFFNNNTMVKDLDLFLQILNEPVPFADSPEGDDADVCERLLTEFNEAEADEIASASYAYWIVRSKANDRLPANALRTSALKEIRRHYVGEGRNETTVLAAIREALEYRRRYRFDVVRSCFYDTDTDDDGEDADDLASKYRRLILDDLKRQPMVVRGVDDNDRVIVYKSQRKSPGDTPDVGEAFILTQIYTAERALATNEFASKGKEEKVTAVFNFLGYSRKNTPPTAITLTMLKMIQRCYPERLGVLIVAHPPFWLRGVYNMVWPFLSTATVEKLRFPSGQAAVDDEFQNIVSGNKELEVMLANGDISSVDLTDYTQQPFYSQFEQKH
jgi:hypothetical protein